MALNLAIQIALPAIDLCNDLIDKIDQQKNHLIHKSLWNWSSSAKRVKEIADSIKIIGNTSDKVFTAKLDPEELRYHDKLGKIFKDSLNDKPPVFLEVMRNNCDQTMGQHLRSQLKLAVKEITPHTTTKSFLDSAAVELVVKEEPRFYPQSRPCEFKETAAKCAKLLDQIGLMERREELQTLNPPFYEILSDIALFREEHEITFRTQLKHQDIVYYDRLLAIYFQNTQSPFCTKQEQKEEEYALNSIKKHLSKELNGVIKLCDPYQKQLEMEDQDETEPTPLLLLDQ